jgi:hypothetical protein
VKSCKKFLAGLLQLFILILAWLDIDCQVFIFMLSILQIICTFDISKIMCYNHDEKGVEEKNGKKSYSSHV